MYVCCEKGRRLTHVPRSRSTVIRCIHEEESIQSRGEYEETDQEDFKDHAVNHRLVVDQAGSLEDGCNLGLSNQTVANLSPDN